ncbi:CobW family GTP-binding protein [Shewanella livingstonensis]|uniref:GTP-binding protein n=1 Tax=Shewanella livingstonensis TaxID=150120 RepID=A0A3G8LXF8_9GAMM|nr:CobW family GTP-binding protein [Shewanella livingstonensis]AZG74094.1 GTP-binding protein [Shewanella livingstonensis]
MITKPINTNIITGFLGVGKTTLISQLLAHKPKGEVWAVLVNEFGEIGIDGGLLNATVDADDVSDSESPIKKPTVVIKEVPGGCLCCVSGLPTQVAINQLIQQTKPDRLLIEPTGLGHPAEIAKLLTSEYYQHVINLQSSVCLVDARKVSDPRYQHHDTFIQQLKMADVLLANKAQYYTHSDHLQLQQFLSQLQLQQTPLMTVANHFTDVALVEQILVHLNTPTKYQAVIKGQRILGNKSLMDKWLSSEPPLGDIDSPEFDTTGFMHKTNQGEGCYSSGWVFSAVHCFQFERFMTWIDTVKIDKVLRLKAIVITSDGVLGVNMVDDKLVLNELDDALDSRVEIISDMPLENARLQQQLLSCLLT